MHGPASAMSSSDNDMEISTFSAAPKFCLADYESFLPSQQAPTAEATSTSQKLPASLFKAFSGDNSGSSDAKKASKRDGTKKDNEHGGSGDSDERPKRNAAKEGSAKKKKKKSKKSKETEVAPLFKPHKDGDDDDGDEDIDEEASAADEKPRTGRKAAGSKSKKSSKKDTKGKKGGKKSGKKTCNSVETISDGAKEDGSEDMDLELALARAAEAEFLNAPVDRLYEARHQLHAIHLLNPVRSW